MERAVVPDLVGLTAREAHNRAYYAGVLACGVDPDGPPLVVIGAKVVTAQHPAPGTVVERRAFVTVLFAGDRAPLHGAPDNDRLSGASEVDE
ncbi:PASTA domain-containing protein [Dactylosporangium sp. AC04546]|nr:PASTA domain-containing protein [Dactylosporangium sp. AC04546]WVK89531.1 PASTA domain-containing protein [Dactylosporangium sp. AC04546]